MPGIGALRRDYHRRICDDALGLRAGSRVFNVADGSSPVSVDLAAGMVAAIGLPTCTAPPTPQGAGAAFTWATCAFLTEAFALLGHVRPGRWSFATTMTEISRFDQYAHLADLAAVARDHPELATILGPDYIVKPDIVLLGHPSPDSELDPTGSLFDDPSVATRTPARAANGPLPVLAASISCKWTMRSDRAQNTRTEALNLVRNRKGMAPKMVAVTMEPQPSRLASIAMGTGDIDCTYHGALDELLESARSASSSSKPMAAARDMLETLVEGRRLRDISDLPFDLLA